MKRITKYITGSFVLGLALLCSCNSLDQAPTNKFTDDKFWTSEERAQMVLNMGYNQMYGFDKIWLDESLSDNMISYRGNPDEYRIRTGTATASLGLFETEWKWIFQGIKTTNVFMDKINLVPGISDARKTEMIAQIRFIRAYLYFRLTNFYGDIPFFLGDITLAESRKLSRTPKAEVIEQLHIELEEIIPLLPSRDEIKAADNGRITKAAAMMLNARIYLYDGNYRKVADICDKLIHDQGEYGTYDLFRRTTGRYTAYEGLFQSANEYNSEVILDYSAMQTVKEYTKMGEMVPLTAGANLTQRAPTRSLVDSYLKKDGTKATTSTPYSDIDPRLTATVVYNGYRWYDKDDSGNETSWTIEITTNSGGKDYFAGAGNNNTPTGYYTRKYFDPDHGKELKMWTNPIIMRYADVLLMYAEAKNEVGEMNEVVWNETIKPIRERAGFNAEACEYPSAADMKALIRNERRCELALEGLRYYDIIRWKAGTEYLTGQIVSCREKEMTIASYAFSARDYLWALPENEVNLVPTLKPNNTGY
ncbi:RagB/SusD family nutrient uptake outer membrane protein [uncultured Alistipes sp.]|jgi:putative outer membrane protein|uniref:RagB/SusD family nutrient uptake outer membrane protein n=1 Tax=uncultured Alistipes sp. TaxID=538949 RepID=UPI0025E67E5E|nr:RagB/SusD family nutrient uptake outer membrane protein [uncultured Alistipes sp.]